MGHPLREPLSHRHLQDRQLGSISGIMSDINKKYIHHCYNGYCPDTFLAVLYVYMIRRWLDREVGGMP